MDHDRARRLLAIELDGELDPALAKALAQHLGGCAACAAHADHLALVQVALRTDVEPAPDVRAGVLAAVRAMPSGARPAVGSHPVEVAVVAHRPDLPIEPEAGGARRDRTTVVDRPGRAPRSRGARRWLPVAACLVVGLLIGSALVGGWRSRPSPAAAQVPERVAAAQFAVTQLRAGIEITERGWNAQVPVRTFTGTLDYEAPEALALHLVDTTTYPSDAWVPDDVDLVRQGEQWWARGPRNCASSAQPGCTPPEPQLEVVDAIAPHDPGVPVPLDLVVPVRSFLRAPEPATLGTTTIDGRDAVGVQVTAAQVGPLLDGLRPAGNLRDLFPSDVVALWLDAASLTPLRIEVRATDDPDRRTWAIDRGYVDRPGDEVLAVTFRDVRVNEGIDRSRLQPAPPGGVRRDAGFVPTATGGSGPGDQPIGTAGVRIDGVPVDESTIPAGLSRSTAGVVGLGTDHLTVIQTWDGGRGWVRVASTTDWDGTELFGGLDSPVRRAVAADGSVSYASLDGARHAVHAADVDVVVTGSVDDAALARITAGLGVAGIPVPSDWREAATESIRSATELLPGLLVAAPGSGFGDPAVRADGNVVTQGYAGAGGQGFVVVEAPGERLPPPLDLSVVGVAVRGFDGRFSTTRGELEWVEGDRTHRISSTTMSRAELLAVADAMVPA